MEPVGVPLLFVVHVPDDAWFVEGFLLAALQLPPGAVLVSGNLELGAVIVEEIARGAVSPVTVVVVSPAFAASPWAQFANQLAVHNAVEAPGGAVVVPAILADCTLPLLSRCQVSLDFRIRDREHWEAEAGRLRNRLAVQTPSVAALDCPYPGIRPFAASDAAHFYGRKLEISKLLGQLRDGMREIYVIGPSGSGKSSVVAAGLLPALHSTPELAGGRGFVVVQLQPGGDPAGALAVAVGAGVDALLADRPDCDRLLIFVDQLEELFTLAHAASRTAFAAALRSLRADPRVHFVLTLRADFYSALIESPLWGDLDGQLPRLDIGPLRGDKLRLAIEAPARALGVHFEPVLVERMLHDVADEPGALPLLQDALFDLWHHRTRRLLRLAEYEAMGDGARSGLAVSVARRATSALSELPARRRQIARIVLLRLIQFGDGAADTRRRQPRAALAAVGDAPAEVDAVLRHLVDRRLVTISGDGADAQVDLAHEVLLSAWPALAEWVAARKQDELYRRALEAKVAEWVIAGRGKSRLLDADELREVHTWRERDDARDLGLSDDAYALIANSDAALTAQRDEVRVSQLRRRRAIALSVTTATALAVTGAVIYVRNIAAERDRADAALHEARRERDRARLSEASQLLENDPNRAKELLASLTLRSPQYALLTGRMQQLSAAKVVAVSGVVDLLLRAPGSATVELVTRDGGFHRLEPSSAQIEPIDHDLTGAVSYRAGQWLYARRTYGVGSVRIASPMQSNMYDVDLTSVSRLVALNDAVYALDGANDLHRLDGKTAAVVDHGVRNIVGDGDLRLVCKHNGELEIFRKDAVVFRGRCPATGSPVTMAAVHNDYAVLNADRVLVADRGGKQIEVPTPIRAEYELALSSNGVIAIGDYRSAGTSWFVRPDGNALEAGPAHNAPPYSVAVDGNLAAWGYTDGTALVLDTVAGTVWPLRGQSGEVSSIVIDAANARVVTAGPHELRVWELKQPLGALAKAIPCRIGALRRAA